MCNLHRGQPVHIHPWSSEPKRVPFGAAQFTIARTGCAAIMLASSGSPSSGTHALWSARHAPGVSDVPRLTLWRVLAYASTSHLPGEGVDRGQPTRLDSSTACSRGAFNNDALPRANVETRAGALVAGALPCSSQSSNRRRSKGGREAAPRVAVLTMTQMTQRQKAHSNRGRCSHVLSMMNSTF